jgi:aminoglycoside phosphotransferase family enzyme/predicted kinase
MELSRLIEVLSDPASYPHTADAVEVRQTHISAVFLAGPFAYKVKKPLDLGFLDYTTLGRRRHFCEQEVRLNRRLAPEVYLGTVPIAADGEAIRVEGPGEVVEWAVKMVRLPEEATLRERLRRGEVGPGLIEALARRIAAFNAQAGAGPAVASFGRFDVVAGNARENFAQSVALLGTTLSRAVFERLQALTESALAGLRPLIEARAARGVPRDGHGDLRLDHAYHFPDRPPPGDLVVIDCIEFNERFRCADPVSDVAFPVMDLARLGRRDLARAFADAYALASGDAEGLALLPFYTAYRAAVRGKVEGMELAEPEVPEAERADALAQARAHWLLALGELEAPGRRPCLVLVGGLPGVGKSTLARGLADRAGFVVIRSDEVRKALAGRAGARAGESAFEAGIYAPAWTERTYAECLHRAEARLFAGDRVLVDASFRAEASRRAFLDAAARWGVPALLMACHAGPEVVHARLARRREDASDADWGIYLRATARWEELGPASRPFNREIATGGSPVEALAQALDALDRVGLWGSLRSDGAAPDSAAPGQSGPIAP